MMQRYHLLFFCHMSLLLVTFFSYRSFEFSFQCDLSGSGNFFYAERLEHLYHCVNLFSLPVASIVMERGLMSIILERNISDICMTSGP